MGRTPQCPSCKAPLAKMPQRKTKCKACGEFIFVKSTPDNREKRLMNQAQADAAEKAWAAHYENSNAASNRPSPALLYQQFLQQAATDLARYKSQGFQSVQVFGGNDRTCSVCRALLGQVLPVSTLPSDILRADCERLAEGGYHCAPLASPVIKDGSGNVRFDRCG